MPGEMFIGQPWRQPYSAQQLAAVAANQIPIIGENGNWWRWDIEQGKFVDTGIAAQGPEGISQEDADNRYLIKKERGEVAALDIVGTQDDALKRTISLSLSGGLFFRQNDNYGNPFYISAESSTDDNPMIIIESSGKTELGPCKSNIWIDSDDGIKFTYSVRLSPPDAGSIYTVITFLTLANGAVILDSEKITAISNEDGSTSYKTEHFPVRIHGIEDPTNDTDAANKKYVDENRGITQEAADQRYLQLNDGKLPHGGYIEGDEIEFIISNTEESIQSQLLLNWAGIEYWTKERGFDEHWMFWYGGYSLDSGESLTWWDKTFALSGYEKVTGIPTVVDAPTEAERLLQESEAASVGYVRNAIKAAMGDIGALLDKINGEVV